MWGEDGRGGLPVNVKVSKKGMCVLVGGWRDDTMWGRAGQVWYAAPHGGAREQACN